MFKMEFTSDIQIQEIIKAGHPLLARLHQPPEVAADCLCLLELSRAPQMTPSVYPTINARVEKEIVAME